MGFVKLPDNLNEWAWYNDNIALLVYIRLRLEAKYKSVDVGNAHLERGQLVTSIREISEKNNISIRQTRTALERLETSHKIAIKPTAKNSVITVLDYDCASDSDTQNDILTASKRQTERQTSDTLATQCRHTDDTPSLLITNSRVPDEQTSSEYAPACEPSENSETEPQAIDTKRQNKPVKRKFAEFVSMTNDEYSSLVTELGEQGTKRCFEILDNYKGQSGKTYKSDYRTIRNWVITRYEEEQAKRKQQTQSKPSGAFNTGNPFLDMLRDLDEREANEIDIQGNVADNGDT